MGKNMRLFVYPKTFHLSHILNRKFFYNLSAQQKCLSKFVSNDLHVDCAHLKVGTIKPNVVSYWIREQQNEVNCRSLNDRFSLERLNKRICRTIHYATLA